MQGYLRKDGRLGIRNQVQLIFLVECAHHVAHEIAAPFDSGDVQYFGFPGCYPNDYGYLIVKNLATHPNVGAVLLVSLGCECFDRERLAQEIEDSGRPCRTLVIQENHGTATSIERGRRHVEELRALIAACPRQAMGIADLVIGTVCGGSDGTSGITGNPAVGRAFDRLLREGAICIFEESGELIGCEEHMMARAANEQVRGEIGAAMDKASRYYETMGLGSFSDGNAVGGLTTQEEKSMGAYAKSGDSLIQGVIRPGQIPVEPGLYLLDVVPDGEPRFGFPNICDSAEIMELAASGCHMVLFTTGRGSVVGSAIAPVIKICNNPETYANMPDDMDINAGAIISEGASLESVADAIIAQIMRIACGETSCSERLGHREFMLTYKNFAFEKTQCRLR